MRLGSANGWLITAGHRHGTSALQDGKGKRAFGNLTRPSSSAVTGRTTFVMALLARVKGRDKDCRVGPRD